MSQFTVTKPSASQWRVSFNNEPINLFGSQSILELRSIIEDAEQDENLNVILFESANPDYFIAHWDLTDDASALPTGPTGHGAFMDAMIRLSRLPVITVSSIRGRARGAGSEFLLATDIRFASRERARIGQFEMSGGVVPGGGGIGRLTRLAGFLPRAVRELKQLTDAITLPENDAFAPEADAFHNGLGQPETQGWAQRMFERGLQQPGVLEENLMEEAEPLHRRS